MHEGPRNRDKTGIKMDQRTQLRTRYKYKSYLLENIKSKFAGLHKYNLNVRNHKKLGNNQTQIIHIGLGAVTLGMLRPSKAGSYKNRRPNW